jgi:protein required for attachment to host cells
LPKLKIENRDWIVVCDGAKALILENAGDGVFPNLTTREVHTLAEFSKTHQSKAPPGRVFQSVGNKRSAVEQADPHELREQDFLQELAARLHTAVTSGEAKVLVIVAAPRALGILREASTPAVRKAIRAEIHKDYVRLPVYEIEKLLVA